VLEFGPSFVIYICKNKLFREQIVFHVWMRWNGNYNFVVLCC